MQSKRFKALLLLGAFHFFSMAEVMAATRDADPIALDERIALLDSRQPEFKGYLKHQSAAVVMQASIHALREELIAEARGTAQAQHAVEKRELEKRIAYLQQAIEKKGVKRTIKEKEAELARIEELIEEAKENIKIAQQGRKGVKESEAEYIAAGHKEELETYEWQKKILSTPTAQYELELAQLRAEQENLVTSEKRGAEEIEDKLFKRALLKLRTIYDLRPVRGGTELITRRTAHLENVNTRYGEGATASGGIADYERDNTVSLFKEVVSILHSIGVPPYSVSGVITDTDGRYQQEALKYMPLLSELLMGIETPSVQFRTADLPMPHNVFERGGGYVPSTDEPRNFLEALAFMAQHIASVFDMRLREDVASLKDIVGSRPMPLNPEGKLGNNEDPTVLMASSIWQEDYPALLGLWGVHDVRGQEAFVDIVKLYDPAFDLRGNERVLNAAIPPNPLGMVYRLVQAAERDIHSWNPTDQFDLDAQIERRQALWQKVMEDGGVVKSTRVVKLVSEKLFERFPEHTWVNVGVVNWKRVGDKFYLSDDFFADTEVGLEEIAARLGITADEEETTKIDDKFFSITKMDDEFLEAVQRIVGRHFNKLILERMAENVRAMSGSGGTPTGVGKTVSRFGFVKH